MAGVVAGLPLGQSGETLNRAERCLMLVTAV